MDVGCTTTRKWEVELRLEQQPRITFGTVIESTVFSNMLHNIIDAHFFFYTRATEWFRICLSLCHLFYLELIKNGVRYNFFLILEETVRPEQ